MKRNSFADQSVEIVSYIFIILFASFCIIPFILVITSSISDELMLVRHGYTFIPKKISFEAYKVLFRNNIVFNAYKVTTFITIIGTISSLSFTSAMAYALSIKTFRARNKVSLYVYFTMLFNGGLVPQYILITKYLHLNDTIWVYIIPALINPWNMFILRSFFVTIPDSLSESAKIDGANDIYILWKIVIPLSKPALASIGLFYALGYWNEWFKATLYITNQKLVPLQYLIMQLLRDLNFMNEYSSLMRTNTTYIAPQYTARMATTIAAIGPIIFLYPFIQKYFVKGLTIGAIKG